MMMKFSNHQEAKKEGKKERQETSKLQEMADKIVESLEKVVDFLKDLLGGLGEKENKKLEKSVRDKQKKMAREYEKKDRERAERIQNQENLRQLYGEAKERKVHDETVTSKVRQNMDTSFQSDIRAIQDQNREEHDFYKKIEDQQETSINKQKRKRKKQNQRVKNAGAERVSIGGDGSGLDSTRSGGHGDNWGSGLDGRGDEFPPPDEAGMEPAYDPPESPDFNDVAAHETGNLNGSPTDSWASIYETDSASGYAEYQAPSTPIYDGYEKVGDVNDVTGKIESGDWRFLDVNTTNDVGRSSSFPSSKTLDQNLYTGNYEINPDPAYQQMNSMGDFGPEPHAADLDYGTSYGAGSHGSGGSIHGPGHSAYGSGGSSFGSGFSGPGIGPDISL